ncbi:hypothetical protein JST97_29380 [bacterium]|nr:hypothetical protein [bacterium]
MLKRNIPEFLAAIGMAALLLFGYASRSSMPWPRHYPTPRPRIEPHFLLELENPKGNLRVGNQGEVSGMKQGRLAETDFNDLRLAAQKLHPGSPGGSWKLRFYDGKGAHEISFDPGRADPEVRHILDNLRILGYL